MAIRPTPIPLPLRFVDAGRTERASLEDPSSEHASSARSPQTLRGASHELSEGPEKRLTPPLGEGMEHRAMAGDLSHADASAAPVVTRAALPWQGSPGTSDGDVGTPPIPGTAAPDLGQGASFFFEQPPLPCLLPADLPLSLIHI